MSRVPGKPIDQMTPAEIDYELRARRQGAEVRRPYYNRDEPPWSFGDVVRHALLDANHPIPENDRDLARAAVSSVAGVAAIEGTINSAILDGFTDGQADTTIGWVRQERLPNFLAAELAHTDAPPQLTKLSKGQIAPHAQIGLTAPEGWKLARFGCQFSIDETDLADDEGADRYVPTLHILQLALAEVGKAARRLIPDLVYSVVMTNANLADGTPLFHSSRGNTDANDLSEPNLDTGLASIAKQVLTTPAGDPAHVNLQPRYLIVNPDDVGLGHRLARAMALSHGEELIVRGESRLSTAGLVDPRNETLISPGGEAWLLACAAGQAPGIVLAALGGNFQPRIRSFTLDQGEWGLGFDVSFDLACTAVSGRPLYLGSGAP